VADETIPAQLRDAYAAWRWTPAWTYGDTVTTWRLVRDGEVRYAKVKPADAVVRLVHEARAMRWAAEWIRVPQVIDAGTSEDLDWLVTAEMAGTPAIDKDWCADPAWLVPIVARGLRVFHDTLPVAQCPFRWSVADALGLTRERIDAGVIPWHDVHREHVGMTVEEAYAELVRIAPTDEDAVVCHGDYCYPNVFIEHGVATGYLDLGELAVSDRWWDVAIGMWSTTWNVGEGYEELFAESYGVAPDHDKIRFYRLLYDFVP
jgi:kanamycin kinase